MTARVDIGGGPVDERKTIPDNRAAIVGAGYGSTIRDGLARELSKRYGEDYDVHICTTHEDCEARLDWLKSEGVPIALIMAAFDFDEDKGGIEYLGRLRSAHPTARRVAVVRWGDFSSADPVFEALTLGKIDHWVMAPSAEPDEEFHRFVTEFLSYWADLHERGFEAVRIVDDGLSPRARELLDQFRRNSIPTRLYDIRSPMGRQTVEESGLASPDLPLVILRFGSQPKPLANPSALEIAEAFDVFTSIDPEERFDVTVIGAGPAGLGAAVYAASEGLKTLIVEWEAVGGQAGTSSFIRNYLGFPQGTSGTRLIFQAFLQAWSFGSRLYIFRRAESLARDGDDILVHFSDDTVARSRTVVVATGAAYRRLGVSTLEDLQNRGVFYGAAVSEAPAMRGKKVFVVGGGNSAGQAALHLARYAHDVTILVRSHNLAHSMSDYLIKEIDSAPNVTLMRRTAIVGGGGDDCLDHLVLQDLDSGREQRVHADGLFVLIGSEPHTEWLAGAVKRDEWGYVLTGPDLAEEGDWTLDRPPLLFETSMPGVFAAGDVRRGSVKRVASAVGQGAIVVQLIHQYLSMRDESTTSSS